MTTLAPAALTRTALAARIDHTLLRPEASFRDIGVLADQANALGVAAACVSPTRVRLLAGLLDGPLACSVVGFPSGAHDPSFVACEAFDAVDAGASEIDMVLDLGAVKDGDWTGVRTGIETVREAVPGAVLKVILESAVLTDAEIVAACRAARDAGALFVKTSTGLHPAGGASAAAVALMAAEVHPHGMLVKASGGIRTLTDAVTMLAAGADRLGCSATAAMLDELDA